METSIPQKPSAIPRPSGIARPSRLPVLQTHANNAPPYPHIRPAGSIEKTRSKPSVPTFPKPAPSTVSQPRTALPSASSRRVSGAAKGVGTESSGGTFKKPVGRPPPRPAPQAQRRPSVSESHVGHEDQLGALDGFRASSRQGFREAEPIQIYDEAAQDESTPKPRKSRPSLSDRTIESLSHIPPSPAGGRRKSSFFTPQSPMGPPSRPASAMSNARRPGTSDGAFAGTPYLRPTTPSRRAPGAPLTPGPPAPTPSQRSVSAALPRVPQTTGRMSFGLKPSTARAFEHAPSATPSGRGTGRPPSTGSKTMISRTPKSRPAVSNLFAKPNSRPAALVQAASKETADTSTGDSSPETAKKIASSSAALREQIAKARAAARKTTPKKQDGVVDSLAAYETGFDLSSDPFNLAPKTGSGLLRKRVDAARADGRLNIAAMGLKEIPMEVLNMYDYDPNDSSKITWSEVVDLTRFIAAENELEGVTEVFPDTDPELASMADDDDDVKKPQFGGVEFLDLHGNLLREVPLGLRRLQYLTSLNLSRNRLGVDALNIIGQVASLKELKIADNNLEGELPNAVCRLKRLEVLEVQGNRLSSLPDGLIELINLRILNLTENSLSALPMAMIETLPLIELLVAKNKLSGTLFSASCTSQRLQLLDVSNNAFESLSGNDSLSLPSLRTLNINTNRIKTLPDISTWTSLISLLAQDNKLSDLPDGFTALPSLRNVDFTGNDFVKLDERLALIKSLEVFTIAANPLRERKFLTMSTDDLKRDLAARLAPSDRGRIPEGYKAEEIGQTF